nr:Dolichyl-phosphate-mannose-protein mannosyltransferase [uncultured bacterium]
MPNFPYAFNYDEINTGVVAHAYINGPFPSVFSTLWDSINLPALWFSIVAGSLNLFGTSLVGLRVPAALFSAVTVLPLYGIVRQAWGRTAAIAGGIIFSFSAVELNYSRITLNNIVTPFFWTVCFFFVLRGLRTRRPIDWLLAGLAGGLGEHFYYGTRLLPFILIGFMLYLLVIHWRQGWRYLGHFGILALGYLAGFGPLLAYFNTVRPDLYFGRTHEPGALKWDHIPTSLEDLQRMWNTLWPLMSDNLLGISTNPARDNFYAAPMLMQAEAALLVLGVALLIWRWRQPAAFLTLLVGFGVLFVGGTLINGTPFIIHWTPAFPAFYAALAVPVGAWAAAGAKLPQRLRPLVPITLALGLCVLGGLNLYYFFQQYKARPQEEARSAQDRAQAALGTDYRVFDVGPSSQGWDVVSMQYFIQGQEGQNLNTPETQIPVPGEPGKGLAFFFYWDNEVNRPIVVRAYPGGQTGEIKAQDGAHLFATYIITPQQAQAMYGAYAQVFKPGSDQQIASGQVPLVGLLPPEVSYPLRARWIAGLYVQDAGTYRL